MSLHFPPLPPVPLIYTNKQTKRPQNYLETSHLPWFPCHRSPAADFFFSGRNHVSQTEAAASSYRWHSIQPRAPGHQEALCTGSELPVGLGWARSQLLPSAAPGGAGSACCRHPPPVLPTLWILDFRQMLLLKFIRCLHVTQVQLGLRQNL